MAIAGIEGLAQGFMQGMALKRQNDRQDVLDAQNAEKFGMDKERFATQQAASAFDLQNAQTNAANAATDRKRALGIQARGDDLDATLRNIIGAGDEYAQLGAIEKKHQGDGVKGAWVRDPKTGVIKKDKDGNVKWVNQDGTSYDTNLHNAIQPFIDAVYPQEAAKRYAEAAAKIAEEKRANDAELGKLKVQHEYRIGEIKTTGEQSRIEKIENPNKPLSLSDIKIAFSETYETGQKNADGTSKLAERVDQKSLQTFAKWLKANKKKATNQSYFDWKAENSDGSESATTSGTDTYDSSSQGKLVAKGLAPEVDAVDVSDIAPVVVEKPSAVKSSTAKPSTPKGLTVPRPSSSRTPVKPTGNAGTMSPADYVSSIGGAISDAIPVMPPPKQYPKGASFFGNEANPLDNPKKLGSR